MRRTYILLLFLSFFILAACDKEDESSKAGSILIGTWVEGPDSPYYTKKEIIVYVFNENGECTEYVINEVSGKVYREELYYKLNTKNMLLTLYNVESERSYYHIVKFSDNNKTLIFYESFIGSEGYDENNLPIDDKYYNDIDFIFHKGEYPIN